MRTTDIFPIVFVLLFSFVSLAFADGYLDVSKDTGSSSKVFLQTISPNPTKTYTYTGISGKASARPLVDVSGMKLLGFQATTVADASVPVNVYFCTGTTLATCGSHYMTYPLGGGTVGIGATTKRVAFGIISSATVDRKLTVMGR